jgi:FAD/FMN-containing dehydrogenase
LDITTFTPIFRPATDDELRRIVESSKMHGYTVRMMGARHSWNGMVMQRNEKDVVVISLTSHTTESEGWHNSIHPESSTFRIGAGKSWYDVSALIRPHG